MQYLLLYGITTICLYIYYNFFFNSHLSVLFLFGFLPSVVFGYINKNRFRFNYSFSISDLIIVVNIVLLGLVLSPLIKSTTVDGISFVTFPGISDYYKHLYVITSLNHSGLPLTHPFFPPVTMSYYYGFYLVPAALSRLFLLPPTLSLYITILVLATLGLFYIKKLIEKYVSSTILQIITLAMIIFGTGWDIIPTLLRHDFGFTHHIEYWAFQLGLGTVVNNTYTALLWAPQHFLAAIFSLVLLNYLIGGGRKKTIIVISIVYICLSSLFVFITTIFWIGLIYLFKPIVRKTIFISGLWAIVICVPYLIQLTPRSNLFSIQLPLAYPISSLLFINYFVTFIFENGLLVFGFLCALILSRESFKLKILLFLITATPLVWIQFIRSSNFNDFAMRSVLPVQLVIPILFSYLLSHLKGKYSKYLLTMSLVSVGVSMFGFGFEYMYRWKERKLFGPEESILLQSIKKINPRHIFTTVDRDDWIFLIPSLANHVILSPSLYDAGVYFSSKDTDTSFEENANSIFRNPTTATNLEDLIWKRNRLFDKTLAHFSTYYFDQLIIRQQVWVKQGINPWTILLSQVSSPSAKLAGKFLLFDRDALLNGLTRNKFEIDLNDNYLSVIKDRKIFLTEGVKYLAACADNKEQRVYLEFEDYYSVFEQKFSDRGCVGQIFFAPSSGDYLISLNSKISSLYVFSVLTLPN